MLPGWLGILIALNPEILPGGVGASGCASANSFAAIEIPDGSGAILGLGGCGGTCPFTCDTDDEEAVLVVVGLGVIGTNWCTLAGACPGSGKRAAETGVST